MALDARRRSSIYEKLVPLIGADDANALMSEFPSVEADELVTKHFLRAELGELRQEVTALRGELRTDMAERFRQQTVWLGGAIGASTASLAALLTVT